MSHSATAAHSSNAPCAASPSSSPSSSSSLRQSLSLAAANTVAADVRKRLMFYEVTVEEVHTLRRRGVDGMPAVVLEEAARTHGLGEGACVGTAASMAAGQQVSTAAAVGEKRPREEEGDAALPSVDGAGRNQDRMRDSPSVVVGYRIVAVPSAARMMMPVKAASGAAKPSAAAPTAPAAPTPPVPSPAMQVLLAKFPKKIIYVSLLLGGDDGGNSSPSSSPFDSSVMTLSFLEELHRTCEEAEEEEQLGKGAVGCAPVNASSGGAAPNANPLPPQRTASAATRTVVATKKPAEVSLALVDLGGMITYARVRKVV